MLFADDTKNFSLIRNPTEVDISSILLHTLKTRSITYEGKPNIDSRMLLEQFIFMRGTRFEEININILQ